LTFLGALRCDRLTAPCVFDGPINGQCFRSYVEAAARTGTRTRRHRRHGQSRLPQGRCHSPDDPRRQCRALVSAPILARPHPIEQAFAKIKHWMRQAQKRTIEDTWRHIGHLVSSIQPTECRNYFLNAG